MTQAANVEESIQGWYLLRPGFAVITRN